MVVQIHLKILVLIIVGIYLEVRLLKIKFWGTSILLSWVCVIFLHAYQQYMGL